MTDVVYLSVTILGETFTNDYHPTTGMLSGYRTLFFRALSKVVEALDIIEDRHTEATQAALDALNARDGIVASAQTVAQSVLTVTQKEQTVLSSADQVEQNLILSEQKAQAASASANLAEQDRIEVAQVALSVAQDKQISEQKAQAALASANSAEQDRIATAQNALNVAQDKLVSIQKAQEASDHAGTAITARDVALSAKVAAEAAAAAVEDVQLRTVARNLTATGSVQADAYSLTLDDNYIATVPMGTGVCLAAATVGKVVIVVNQSANNLKVYPHLTNNFNVLAPNAPITLAPKGFLIAHGETTSKWVVITNQASDMVMNAPLDLGNQSIVNFNAISPTQPILIVETSGNITIDFRISTHYIQSQPTGAIAYTIIPPEVSHTKFELTILNNGSGTAQVVSMPAGTVWMGSTWTPVDNKFAILNGKHDGTKFIFMGSNQT